MSANTGLKFKSRDRNRNQNHGKHFKPETGDGTLGKWHGSATLLTTYSTY
jgi:hypothetical protein